MDDNIKYGNVEGLSDFLELWKMLPSGNRRGEHTDRQTDEQHL